MIGRADNGTNLEGRAKTQNTVSNIDFKYLLTTNHVAAKRGEETEEEEAGRRRGRSRRRDAGKGRETWIFRKRREADRRRRNSECKPPPMDTRLERLPSSEEMICRCFQIKDGGQIIDR